MDATLIFRDGSKKTGEIYEVRDDEINLDGGQWHLFTELQSIVFNHD